MTVPEDELSMLKATGAAALTFNAPLGSDRARALVDWLAAADSAAVVDLGCGRGVLARMVAERSPSTTVTGVDNDPAVLARAQEMADGGGLGERLTFVVEDATAWVGVADAAICIGASHAFGGPTPMVQQLAALPGVTRAIVGDGLWQATPDPWCLDTFGPLPEGIEQFESIVVAAGWSVEGQATSTIEEWDGFENGWIAGVRSVGTPEATAFADERSADYERYRGTLGFGWLQLIR